MAKVLDQQSASSRYGTLVDLYQQIHRGTLHLHRDARTHAETLLENPGDIFLLIEQPARGYVRLNRQGEGLDIIEAVIANEDRAPVLRACAALAMDLGENSLHGWLAPDADLREWFIDRGRTTTLPMVRGDVQLDGSVFWAADYF